MLKFSLSVRLTNSIRHLQPEEVVRGLQLADVLATPAGRRFTSEHPEFKVLREPAFMALKDGAGGIIKESIVVFRENPFRTESTEGAVVLATLTQDHPLRGESLIQGCVRRLSESSAISRSAAAERWFRAYLQTVVRPLMAAQFTYGILMGAHQQNIIVRLRDDVPTGGYFRDCQGTGYSRLGAALFGENVERLSESNGNILENRSASHLFAYYLMVNSTFNVICALGADDSATESRLMSVLRETLAGWLGENPQDPSCLSYLLFERELMQKGNFVCSLSGLNENTSRNPLAIYCPMPNPLFNAEKVTMEVPQP